MSANGRLSTDDLIRLIEERTGKQARKVGREMALICPSHPDTNPSLHIREGDAGMPIMQCRSAGCTNDQILSALDLTWADVYGDDSEHWMPNNRTWVALYDYHDADGTLLYQVARSADKDFSQRHPNPDKRSGWEWNLNGVKRVPYHLPQLLAEPTAEAFLAEGEKDVQALEAHGLVATCNSGGAGKWLKEFARYFTGRTVTIVAHNDEPGYAHALQVHASLEPVAASCRIVISPAGNDAADHFAAGLGVEAFEAVTVEALRTPQHLNGDAPPAEDAPPTEGERQEAPSAPRELLRFLTGAEFRHQPRSAIEPLLGDGADGLLMPGSLALLAGIGGTGKTTLALHAAIHLCAGIPWIGINLLRPLRILLIENEGPHDPFADKVDRMCERFHDCPCSGSPHGDTGAGFDVNAIILDSPWGRFTFDDPGLAAELNAAAVDFQADLVIANPLGRLGMKGAGTPEETRGFLDLLVRAGMGDVFAALLIHHMAKGKQMSLSQQISGDWGGHPDTILILESAGQRRSKLTFDKIRWGDQGAREPLILDWLVADDGPVGYTLAGAPKGIPDEQVYERIDQFMRESAEPPGMTAIQQGITGQHKRLKQLVEAGVANGRYGQSTGKRKVFWLAGEGPEQETMDV